jgi:hypothetical protein
MSVIKTLCDRALSIRRESGLRALLKTSFQFIILPVYEQRAYCLFEYQVRNYPEPVESSIKSVDGDITFKTISSNEEAERLEKEGYGFRSHSTDWNYHRKTYSRWLGCGAVACCTFVDKEFAAIVWVILSQYTHDHIGTIPIKVSYSNHEIFGRGAWTNPKYRKLGVFSFNLRNRDRILTEKGIKMIRIPVDCANEPGMALMKRIGCQKYGQARYRKILGRIYWKEFYDK